jgi:hypothetical protein
MEVLRIFFCGCELTVLLVDIFHGRFPSMGVMAIMVMVISHEVCFELVISIKWVGNTLNAACRMLESHDIVRKTAVVLG